MKLVNNVDMDDIEELLDENFCKAVFHVIKARRGVNSSMKRIVLHKLHPDAENLDCLVEIEADLRNALISIDVIRRLMAAMIPEEPDDE